MSDTPVANAAVRLGIAEEPRHRERYYTHFPLLELRSALSTPPTQKTLRKWASESKAANPAFEHVLLCWQGFTHEERDLRGGLRATLQPGERLDDVGHFKESAANVRLWQGVLENAAALEAKLLMLETPASFTPSAANKARLRSFAKGWSALPPGLQLAWHPAGFWSREECIEVCDEVGWRLVLDPLVDPDEPMPRGKHCYCQMLGRHGLFDRYGDEDLERLCALIDGYEDCIVTFRTRDSFRDARRMLRMLADYEPSDDDELEDDEELEDDDLDELDDDEEDEDGDEEDEDGDEEDEDGDEEDEDADEEDKS